MQKKFIFSFIILIVSIIIYFYQKSIKENYPLNSPDFKILKIYNRKNDSKTYTQGLMFSDDKKTIYESAGLYKESGIKQFEYPSLKLIKNQKINSNYFGEGIAKCGNFIYQLTWREKKIIKYNKNLEIIEEFEMDNKINEGWGLSDSNNKNELFATDGSDKIYRLDCNNNLKVIEIINVKYNGRSINYLNDLCYAEGYIFLNIYFLNQIAKVNINNGEIIQLYNMQSLIDFELKKGILTRSKLSQGDVLNGIAYNDKTKSFLITGKRWGYMYEIKFKK